MLSIKAIFSHALVEVNFASSFPAIKLALFASPLGSRELIENEIKIVFTAARRIVRGEESERR